MVLASACRRKILRVLRRVEGTYVMDLVREVNSTYSQVNPNLKILETEYLIVDEHLGRLRWIKLNRENPKTERLLQALRLLEPSGDQ